MKERKKFQKQTLNRNDYKKAEKGAKIIKKGGIIVIASVVGTALKKGVPLIIKGVKHIRR